MQSPAAKPIEVSARRNHRRLILLIPLGILVAGVLLAAFTPWKSDRKWELVRDNIIPPAAWAVRNGQLYAAREDKGNLILSVSPVRGGHERILFSLPIKNQSVSVLTLTEEVARFVVTNSNASSPGTYVWSGMRELSGGRSLRDQARHDGYYMPPEKGTVHSKEVQRGTGYVSLTSTAHEETLYQVSLNGNAPKKYTFTWNGLQRHVYVGNTVYWLEPKSKQSILVTLANGEKYNEFPADTALYSRPLTGGASHLIAGGLSPNWNGGVNGDDTGLNIHLNRPYPKPYYDLLRIPSEGTEPSHIAEYHSRVVPELYNGRLWWLKFEATLETVHQKLVSCRPDGSERQEVLLGKDADGQDMVCQGLFSYAGRLFLMYTRQDVFVPENGNVPGRYPRGYLARIHLDGGAALGKPRLMPGTTGLNKAHCEGEYYYSFSSEKRHHPLDFLKEHSTEHTATFLVRVRLPE